MGVKTGSRISSERENWDKIFKGLVKILRTKQDQLESLVKDRQILVDRIKTQHDRWASDVRLYEDHISMMKNEIETMEMMSLVEVAKSNLLVGLKDRAVSLCNMKLEHTTDELDDFKAWFDFLTMNTKNDDSNSKAAGEKSLETEMRKLRLEYEKLASEKNCELSSLLRENGFAWNQFKRLESEFADKLKGKDGEIAEANTKISSLISHQEELQLANAEKDDIISRLKAKVAAMEEDASKKDQEISGLSQELDLAKKSRSSKFTPVLTRCTSRKNSSNGKAEKSKAAVTEEDTSKKDKENSRLSQDLELAKKSRSAKFTPVLTRCTTRENNNNNGKTDEACVVANKDLPGPIVPALLKQSEQGTKGMKRNIRSNTSSIETPKLFTSTFKVPKLKAPSPRAMQLS